jgi:hypothetical protein
MSKLTRQPAAGQISKGNGKPAPFANGQAGSLVFVCEDPGLAPEMRKVALPALCNIQEGSQLKEFTRGRRVAVAYRGPTNRTSAETVASYLESKCYPERVGTIDLTDTFGFAEDPEGFQPWWSEALGNGNQFETGVDFLRLADQRTKWRQSSPIVIDDAGGEDRVCDPIGDVDSRAFHGVIGRLAQQIKKETEASPIFILLHLLAFFGIAAGRGPHFVVAATRHYLNLFVGLIGVSGFSRKGMAADVARAVWSKIDASFADTNITQGLNSGAGLLSHLRDPSERRDKNGKPIRDEGVTDKRRVFLEEEFASVLKQGHRESDPLLEYLRQFYDGRRVVASVVKDPVRVTEGHVSLIGHCTPGDLETYLSDADKVNGTANRVLWVFGVRSQILPKGGNVFDLLDFLESDLQDLRDAVEFVRTVGEMHRTPEAEARWEAIYREFATVPPGRLGAFFVRAAPQVMKIASLFALGDRSRLVDVEPLEAALAIWKHSERTLRFIFKADVDPKAEKLLAELKAAGPDGLTRTQINDRAFSGNMNAESLDELLTRLLGFRYIVQTGSSKGGRGRPAPRYHLNPW